MLKRSSPVNPLAILVAILLLAAGAAADESKVRLAYVPITVRGDYQPLDAATVNALLLQTLKKNAPELEFLPLSLNTAGWDLDDAVQVARENGVDLIAWGSVRFQHSSQTSSGRAQVLVTAIVEIQVASVSSNRRILSQPTMVTSTEQSKSFTDTVDPRMEQRLAKESLREAARTFLGVVRSGGEQEHESLEADSL